jgi:HAE1 family hydrophobic/amphiphilic exporter-1
MNISSLFIRRPIMTTLTTLSILLLGVVGYRLLPVSDLPNVDYPTIQVSASLAGASPETMASSVATPLEKEFSTIAGIDSMSSSSSLGSTSITIQFVLNRNIDAAAQDVQAAISRAVRRLPSGMSSPPTYRKVNPADQPILYLALTSPTQPMYALDEFGQTTMAQRISMIDGVAQVQVFGSQKYAVRVQLDPRELAFRGLGINEVSDAIQKQNVNLPLGVLNGAFQSFTMEDNGLLTQADRYMPLVVAYRNGQPVRLQDVGRAIDSVENDKVAAWYWSTTLREASQAQGETPTTAESKSLSDELARQFPLQRAIVLAIQRQPGTNTVEVADAIKALLPEFRSQLPASVSLHVLRDGSRVIKESAADVQFTLVLTLALVVMVIFLFLRNFSATVIPSLVLPMSILGTFAVMHVLDYSLDNLSLMALTLSVGFVVDDAIVMLENIVRHMEMGKPRMQAAMDGAKEIGFTIVSMTLSLAAVFIPFLLMGGLVGRLFREFSVTIGAAVIVSGFVSLTLTPMLASRFLKDQHKVHHGRLYEVSEKCFNWMADFYGWTLKLALDARRMTMLISLVLLAATVWLFQTVSKGFIPSEDRDMISGNLEAAQDVSFARMSDYTLAVGEVLKANENIDRFMASAGSGGTNNGRMLIMLKPRSERRQSADEIINDLRPKLAAIPGIKAYLSNPLALQVGGRSGRSLYQVTIQGGDTEKLYRYAGELEQKIRDGRDFLEVNSDMLLKSRQLTLKIDRNRAVSLGITPMQIEDAFYNAFGSRQISTILTPNNQYQVILELLPQYQTEPSLVERLHVKSSTGQVMPISALLTMSEDIGPLQVNHTGQLPSVTISFNLRPGVSLGEAVEQIRQIAQASMPEGLSFSFQGTAQAFQDSMKNMGLLFVMAVVVIYIVLGILYESFYHPLTILSALPFAAFGALLTLWVFHTELTIYAYVGIIMLVGLVKKNGIMMVDFALELQRAGKSAQDAIHEACLVRFRPIMMTTVAALMAGLPIAMGWGAGAESRRPLGLAVVGGLLFSQTLTLYVTPVFFLYMEKIRVYLHHKLGMHAKTTEASATA